MTSGKWRDAQTRYWNRAALTARFTHCLNADWLARHVRRDDRILDFGCGYGRTLRALREAGFSNLTGLDSSEQMLARAAGVEPAATLVHAPGCPCPLPDASFDCVLLFAVLTCQVRDEEQRRIVGEARRLLRPGGLVYISDYPLQDDDDRVRRYRRFEEEFGVYGAFRTADGVAIRHFDMNRFDALVATFTRLEFEAADVSTMHGNSARGFQFLGRATDAGGRTRS